jgi:hypothetical protein
MEVGDVSLATGNRLYFSKKNEESGSLSDSPLAPLLLVFLFFTDASRRKTGGPYQAVGWDQFCSDQ